MCELSIGDEEPTHWSEGSTGDPDGRGHNEEPTHRLAVMVRADLSKEPTAVKAMFDGVAARYDVTNGVVSLGLATHWRRATHRAISPVAGERILDIAAGTGTSSVRLAASGAQVVAADFSPGMLEVGRARHRDTRNLKFVEADAMALPCADGEFDAVTISFGLRNVSDPQRALAEFFRVTKPGGRLVVCEFSHPPLAVVRGASRLFNRAVVPALARLTSSNDDAYNYLQESIAAWPVQSALAAWIHSVGYAQVTWRNLNAGIVALHCAQRPTQ